MFSTRSLLIALGACLALGACRPPFAQRIAPIQGDSLFQIAQAELAREDWDNAIVALERLGRELPARDPQLPRVYFDLGRAHTAKEEHLLAAQSYQRIMESFPNDTLADDGLLEAGRSYAAMWRRTSLDAQYGQTALTTFQTLLAIYPNTDKRAEAESEVREIMEKLARKDYDIAVYYTKRTSPFSAIIFFEDVIERYPDTSVARLARMRMVELYRRINYTAQAADVCAALQASYPEDREVRELCGAASPPAIVP